MFHTWERICGFNFGWLTCLAFFSFWLRNLHLSCKRQLWAIMQPSFVKISTTGLWGICFVHCDRIQNQTKLHTVFLGMTEGQVLVICFLLKTRWNTQRKLETVIIILLLWRLLYVADDENDNATSPSSIWKVGLSHDVVFWGDFLVWNDVSEQCFHTHDLDDTGLYFK